MKILLDFDGVMVTTPSWQAVEQADDGFMAFNSKCVQNLAHILAKTQADIVLTTTHRIHYDEVQWLKLFNNRGIVTNKITKVNQAQSFAELANRCDEVLQWVANNPDENFVIIDDDKSLYNLPDSPEYDLKKRWVKTQFHQGLTVTGRDKALEILLNSHFD
ncbi:HAD domain-containing protein [Psychrobacter sp. I-STPA6b]|uniref:HAD domain-containing protein n=1 Tax=Psychrobacter sp. I-STPA6b TaxID=2585718 RepID=UPI001D0C8737|nr:HAD domain-containing protein [Psychrobacter sp. I-STPA6b]